MTLKQYQESPGGATGERCQAPADHLRTTAAVCGRFVVMGRGMRERAQQRHKVPAALAEPAAVQARSIAGHQGGETMRRPLPMIVTVALTLALSLPGGCRAELRSQSCVNVSVTTVVNVVVTVDVSVNITIGDDGSVALAWQPGTEPDTIGWNVYRADADGAYVKMNGTPIPNDSSHYTDGPGNGQDRHYLLESMSSDGQKKPQPSSPCLRSKEMVPTHAWNTS